ncbi:MAG: hypothetical protein L3K03_06690, partial [Thermoplasmata archaeon]|nr:hypothetical protein [Thermoplasmata archaeon]
VNASVNWTSMGGEFDSWLFLGSYGASAPLAGSAPYALISTVTSTFDAPGFGTQEPVEIPLLVADAPPSIDLTVTVSSPVNSTSTGVVTVTATNATDAPVANYSVTLTVQNAEGANRGTLSNATGTQVEAYTPNSLFGYGSTGSSFIPGLTLLTGSNGQASATFSPGLYLPNAGTGGALVFTPEPYTDPYLVPFDFFQLAVWGGNTSNVAAAVITSNGTSTPASTTSVVTAFLAGSGAVGGVTLLTGDATYPLYVNSTLNTQWGPSVGAVTVNLTTSFGTTGSPSGTTNSAGSFATTYAAPNVTVLTLVMLQIAGSGMPTVTQRFYIEPASAASSNKTTPGTGTAGPSTTDWTDVYALAAVAAILAILAAVFAVMWMSGGKGKQPPKWKDPEDKPSSSSSTSSTDTSSSAEGTSDSAGTTPPVR